MSEVAILGDRLIEAYNLDEKFPIKPISGGIVNQTYLAQDKNGSKVIVQKLNSLFRSTVADDRQYICEELSRALTVTPKMVATAQGKSHHQDGSDIWIASEWIDSDMNAEQLTELTIGQINSMGSLLREVHDALAEIDYTPKHKLPYFHDTRFYLARMNSMASELDPEALLVSRQVANIFEDLQHLLEDTSVQIIHADAAVKNFLIKDNHPIAIIDFDTLMLGNKWIDIGDYIRSLIEWSNLRGVKLGRAHIEAFTEGYGQGLDVQKPIEWAQLICSELSARFLIDTIEDVYFDWDEDKFVSRKAHNIFRAKDQVAIHHTLNSLK